MLRTLRLRAAALGLAVLPACGALAHHGPGLPTGHVVVKGNLDVDAPVLDDGWDPAHAGTTSNFSFSIPIYDSLGHAHSMDVHFRNDGSRKWSWHAMTDGAGVTGGTAGAPFEIAHGTLTFDAQGRLASADQQASFNPIDADQPQVLTFDLGDDTSAGGSGLGGLTLFAGPSATTFVSQDGAA
jgi:flagellar hook protein FlgE